jgi:hypothetical protein
VLDFVLQGRPLESGGVVLDASRVDLGPTSTPNLYEGEITSLSGTDIVAVVRHGAGTPIRLTVAIQIDDAAGTVRGTVDARTAG